MAKKKVEKKKVEVVGEVKADEITMPTRSAHENIERARKLAEENSARDQA